MPLYNFYLFLVEYSKGQEPYLLKSCTHGISAKCISAISPDGRTIAIANTAAADIFMYSAVTGDLQAELRDVHPGTSH